jgi:hypothetical protein
MPWNLKAKIQKKINREALKQFGKNFGLALVIDLFVLAIFFLVVRIASAFPDYIRPPGASELMKTLIEVSGILIGFSGIIYAQLFSSLSSQQNVILTRILEKPDKSDALKTYLKEYDIKWQAVALAAVWTFALLLFSILASLINLVNVAALDPEKDTIAPFGLSFFSLFFIIGAMFLVIIALSGLSLKPPLKVDENKKLPSQAPKSS